MTTPFPQTPDIFALAAWADDQVAARWQTVLDTQRDKLEIAYQKAGDLAYGTYQNLLLRDLKRQLRAASLRATPPLPGDFDLSREWGNADETDQERWMWSVIHAASGAALGTLVHAIPHDHTRFRIPRRPRVFGLAETERTAIEAALSARSADFARAQPFHEWYEEYLRQQDAEGA